MIPYILASLSYVSADNLFWISMAMTTCTGLMIGSVLYDGIIKDVMKGFVVIISYSILLIITILTRIVPIMSVVGYHPSSPGKPLAGVITIVLVTIFYLLGMFLGVIIVKKAHTKLVLK